jgi:hypothetical protein
VSFQTRSSPVKQVSKPEMLGADGLPQSELQSIPRADEKWRWTELGWIVTVLIVLHPRLMCHVQEIHPVLAARYSSPLVIMAARRANVKVRKPSLKCNRDMGLHVVALRDFLLVLNLYPVCSTSNTKMKLSAVNPKHGVRR